VNRMWICVVAVLLIGCPFRPPDDDGPSYSVEITGLQSVDPRADSLNDDDDAAGSAFVGISAIGPVVWRDGVLVVVQHSLGGFGLLHSINNNGAVVGTQSNTAPGGFFPFVSFIGAERPVASINYSGQLFSLNNFNQYVGGGAPEAVLGLVLGGDPSFFQAENSTLTIAYDINDLGDFVGTGANAEGRRAVKWVNTVEVPLDSFGGPFSEAYAINNHGVVVGVSTSPEPPEKTTVPHLAACWMDSDIVALPTLGGEESTAWDINDHGETVGFSFNESGESRGRLVAKYR
jgi:uncharacterized membrane protein